VRTRNGTKRKARLILDPRLNLVYSSYFIAGMQNAFNVDVCFDIRPFVALPQSSPEDHFDHFFACIYSRNGTSLRVVIDFRDKSELCAEALEWAEVYGVVNVAPQDYAQKQKDDPVNASKILAVGPYFGINLYSSIMAVRQALRNHILSKKFSSVSLKRRISSYRWQTVRPKLSWFQPEPKQSRYIFHASTLYEDQSNGQVANSLRASFIRAARRHAIFEGGLVSRQNQLADKSFQDIVIARGFSQKDYMKKTKKSTVVFNTPAAWECLGWKLGEYFAYGNAIISTPIKQMLPAPLKHKENIFFVKDAEQIESAVAELMSDEKLRNGLQNGARKYFETFCSPEAIVERLVKYGLKRRSPKHVN